MEEDDFKVEVRNDKVSNHGTEQKNACSQYYVEDKVPHDYQETLLVDLLQEEGVQTGEVSGVPIS